MKCALPLFAIVTLILFTFILLTEVSCCSYTVQDIIRIKQEDENWESDPCFIQYMWDQQDKAEEFFKRREEKSKENDRKFLIEYDRRMQEYKRYDSYTSPRPKVEQKLVTFRCYFDQLTLLYFRKDAPFWPTPVIIAVLILGICSCVVIITFLKLLLPASRSATTNILETDRNPDGE